MSEKLEINLSSNYFSDFNGNVAQWAIEKEINSNHFIEQLADIVNDYIKEHDK